MKSIGASAYHKNYLQVGAVVQAAVLAAVAVELEAVAAVGDSLRASPPPPGLIRAVGGAHRSNPVASSLLDAAGAVGTAALSAGRLTKRSSQGRGLWPRGRGAVDVARPAARHEEAERTKENEKCTGVTQYTATYSDSDI